MSRITTIAEALDNADTGAAQDGERNLGLDRPAYWHTGSALSHSGALIQSANFYGSLTYAVDTALPPVAWRDGGHRAAAVFDAIIPLNEAAVDELAALYVSHSGTFRAAHELRVRERRYVLGAWPKDRPSALVNWNVRKAAQARWERAFAREAA